MTVLRAVILTICIAAALALQCETCLPDPECDAVTCPNLPATAATHVISLVGNLVFDSTYNGPSFIELPLQGLVGSLLVTSTPASLREISFPQLNTMQGGDLNVQSTGGLERFDAPKLVTFSGDHYVRLQSNVALSHFYAPIRQMLVFGASYFNLVITSNTVLCNLCVFCPMAVGLEVTSVRLGVGAPSTLEPWATFRASCQNDTEGTCYTCAPATRTPSRTPSNTPSTSFTSSISTTSTTTASSTNTGTSTGTATGTATASLSPSNSAPPSRTVVGASPSNTPSASASPRPVEPVEPICAGPPPLCAAGSCTQGVWTLNCSNGVGSNATVRGPVVVVGSVTLPPAVVFDLGTGGTVTASGGISIVPGTVITLELGALPAGGSSVLLLNSSGSGVNVNNLVLDVQLPSGVDACSLVSARPVASGGQVSALFNVERSSDDGCDGSSKGSSNSSSFPWWAGLLIALLACCAVVAVITVASVLGVWAKRQRKKQRELSWAKSLS